MILWIPAGPAFNAGLPRIYCGAGMTKKCKQRYHFLQFILIQKINFVYFFIISSEGGIKIISIPTERTDSKLRLQLHLLVYFWYH